VGHPAFVVDLEQGLIEHYGYFVGRKALAGVAGNRRLLPLLCDIGGSRFFCSSTSGRRVKSVPSQRMMKPGAEPPAEPCCISQVWRASWVDAADCSPRCCSNCAIFLLDLLRS